jgi:outer membrane receptor protein involved in Fe transport
VFETSQDVKAFTHESRAASATGGTIDWLGGVFLSLRNEDLSSRLIADYLAPASIAFLGDRHDESNEAAVFGEITVRADTRLAITAGARLSRIGFGIDAVASGIANSGVPSLVEKRSRIAVAPRVAVSLDASPALFVYAQAAAGSRIGGFNINTPLEAITLLNPNDDVTRFESDTLWNTEIGAKFRLFDNRAKVNISAFYLQWREIQTDQILPTGFTFVTNAGAAQNFGVEIEATARPSPRLEISGAFFWNDPQLTEANPFLNAEKGDLLPNIAEMTASFGATYEVQLTGGCFASANATYSYVGTSVLTFAEDVAPTMGDYHIASVSLKAERDGLRIGVFADNLFDSRGDTFAFGNSFSLATRDQSTPLRPRTLGVYVESSF